MRNTRFDNAQRLIPAGSRLLDYGCGRGEFLQYIAANISQGVGVDLDSALAAGAAARSKQLNVSHLCGDARCGLPFPDSSFDVIAALGVLEHVGPEEPFIKEFYRVLRPGGYLVVDVPSQGPFRWADIGNIKYNLPTLHRWFYLYVARQPQYYHEHFSPDGAMFGQFSREATQHRHYGRSDLSRLLGKNFTMLQQTKYGFFFEFIQLAEVLATKALRWQGHQFFGWLMEHDCRLTSFWGRANTVVVSRSAKTIEKVEGSATV